MVTIFKFLSSTPATINTFFRNRFLPLRHFDRTCWSGDRTFFGQFPNPNDIALPLALLCAVSSPKAARHRFTLCRPVEWLGVSGSGSMSSLFAGFHTVCRHFSAGQRSAHTIRMNIEQTGPSIANRRLAASFAHLCPPNDCGR